MSKMINQDAALKAVDVWESDWPCTYSAILALPTVELETATIRDAALAEAAAAAWAVEGGDRWTRSAAQAAILALMGKPAVEQPHVNKTSETEHDIGNVLTEYVRADTVQDLIAAAEPVLAEAYAASEAENAELRDALSLIAVMGFSDDLGETAVIARMAVEQSRAVLKRMKQ